MKREHEHERINLTLEEKHNEISSRRNQIEMALRVVLRRALVTTHGRSKAANAVLAAIAKPRRDALSADVDELLSRDGSPLVFSDLTSIVGREWHVFGNVFDVDKNKMMVILKEINDSGRPDAHGRGIDGDAFAQLRLHFKKLEEILQEWGE